MFKVVGIESGLYAASMVGLNQLWYKEYPKQKFHFFNDNKEWLQMDKMGHVFSAYYIGLIGMETFDWCHTKENTKVWLGGSLGFIFLSTIEVLDGYSAGWGFSVGDLTANTAGYLLAASQQQLWKEQKIMLKVSFHETEFAQQRPNALGASYAQQILKDYNGQTYWLSFAIKEFLPKKSKFPNWLNIAIGYGATGMYGADDNIWQSNGATYDFSQVQRKRRLLLSLDINLWKIKTKNKFINSVFKTVGWIKIPAPAFEFGTNKFHWLYY